MGYEKDLEMRIVRTKHVVTYRRGTQAIDLLQDLKQVPLSAKLIDSYSCDEEDGGYVLVFELEEEQKQENKKDQL